MAKQEIQKLDSLNSEDENLFLISLTDTYFLRQQWKQAFSVYAEYEPPVNSKTQKSFAYL